MDFSSILYSLWYLSIKTLFSDYFITFSLLGMALGAGTRYSRGHSPCREFPSYSSTRQSSIPPLLRKEYSSFLSPCSKQREDRLWIHRLKSNYSHWPQWNPIKTFFCFKEVIAKAQVSKTPTPKLQTGDLYVSLCFHQQRTGILKEREQWPQLACLT